MFNMFENARWVSLVFSVLLKIQTLHSWDYFTPVSDWITVSHPVRVHGAIHYISTDSIIHCSIHCYLSEVYFRKKETTGSRRCLYVTYDKSNGACMIVLDANTEITFTVSVLNTFLTTGIINHHPLRG